MMVAACPSDILAVSHVSGASGITGKFWGRLCVCERNFLLDIRHKSHLAATNNRCECQGDHGLLRRMCPEEPAAAPGATAVTKHREYLRPDSLHRLQLSIQYDHSTTAGGKVEATGGGHLQMGPQLPDTAAADSQDGQSHIKNHHSEHRLTPRPPEPLAVLPAHP